MALSKHQKNEISNLLSRKIDAKLKRYARESSSMPFLAKLMQDKEKVAAYSFIHSLATTLGMSIYEEVSKIIVQETADECFNHYDIGGVISREQKSIIDNILRELRNQERECNIEKEIEEVLAANPQNGKVQKEGRIADLYMLRDGAEQYFEIKTVKPNIDVFAKSKSKLLEWVARRRKKIKVFLAFPYNPYHPKPYDRFTLVGLLKSGDDMLIGDEYWDYLGGKNTYNEVLTLFDEIGKLYKQRIAEKISEVAKTKMTF
ncbi:MAG: TdeIII family type II restriction endonuclease [Candidatus Lokiarchaeota archaeon]|nr:TdeIII family type II restriction endonuclease [Candidatus Lokiarchaeota archaeon]